MEREPIFWTTTQPGYNDRDRMRTRVDEETGELVVERFPQRGHDGDYDDHKPAERGLRYVNMVRHEGHIVPVVLTNAAAHLDHTDSFGRYQIATARNHGWFCLDECPRALVATGTISERSIVDKSQHGEAPCDPGTYSADRMCRHAQAELKARRARNVKLEANREQAHKNDTQKLIDAHRGDNQALIDALIAQGSDTKALLEQLTKALLKAEAKIETKAAAK